MDVTIKISFIWIFQISFVSDFSFEHNFLTIFMPYWINWHFERQKYRFSSGIDDKLATPVFEFRLVSFYLNTTVLVSIYLSDS